MRSKKKLLSMLRKVFTQWLCYAMRQPFARAEGQLAYLSFLTGLTFARLFGAFLYRKEALGTFGEFFSGKGSRSRCLLVCSPVRYIDNFMRVVP